METMTKRYVTLREKNSVFGHFSHGISYIKAL